ncbi:MAG: prepilin-type N-terminal cleavage/methylation domain-containing protein, partial [Verrucomicrobiaceae bacterium]
MLRPPAWVVSRPIRDAFTLVELMVSMAVISLVMVILLSTVDQTQRIWKRSTNKISQFQAARSAFDSLTRNLSQATLNTYYGVEYDPLGNPRGYHRESELHFVSGKAAQPKLLGGDESIHPTHAIFFQAPLGISSQTEDSASGAGAGGSTRPYKNLTHLL